jgi:hypothetical protein
VSRRIATGERPCTTPHADASPAMGDVGDRLAGDVHPQPRYRRRGTTRAALSLAREGETIVGHDINRTRSGSPRSSVRPHPSTRRQTTLTRGAR